MSALPEQPLREFVRAAATARRRVLARALRRARREPSAEAVHDVRVAIRRLLTVFAVCPANFAEERVRKARKRLKRIMRRAGEVRDRDIALELLDAAPDDGRSAEESPAKAAIRRRLEAERGDAARLFRRAVRKSRRRAVDRLLQAAIGSRPGSAAEPDGWDSKRPAAENARRRLPEMAADLFGLGRQIVAPDAAVADLHRLRLAVKRLRYSLELFRPCYADGLERHIAALRGLQDRLGAINDLGTSARIADAPTGPDAACRAAIGDFCGYWRETFDAPGERERWMLELARPLGATGRRSAA